MTTMGQSYQEPVHGPLDVVEKLASAHDWIFDRRNDEEMAVQVPGRWCDYSLFFTWNDEISAIHVSCAFDMRVPEERRTLVHELLALINEKLWLGHFGIWEDDGLPLFRHALPLRGFGRPSIEQMEDVIDTALVECERFYPAFQYVIWGGRTPHDAMMLSMIETVGEA
jgi:hypothetical protein